MAHTDSATMLARGAAVPSSIDYPGFDFSVTHQSRDCYARYGRMTTPHGVIETPNYIFCGTKAAVRNLNPAQLREAGADIILANTYHLMIRPGADLIARMGGLHKFMNWDGPMLTDSGGFQVFSMGHGTCADEIKGRQGSKYDDSLLEVSEDGARFRSYLDGRELSLNPEISIEIQRKLGADFVVQMDECPAYHVSRDYTANSMHMSWRWGNRSLEAFQRGHDATQAIYGTVHGGVYEDLRRESAQLVAEQPFFGTAIGGCLGGTDDEMYGILDICRPHLPDERPIHFLGIGRIRDVFACVRRGVDTFDCVIPTRLARHGMALMKGGEDQRINLLNARFRDDSAPLDPSLGIAASSQFSRAYIHHLMKSGEMLAFQLLAQHNIAVIMRLMCEVREAIRDDCLDALEREWLGR